MTAASLSLPARQRRRWRAYSVLPGFNLALGFTLTWLSLIVLIPLCALAIRPWENGAGHVLETLAEPRVLAALRLSFFTSAAAAAVNAPLGLLVAWVLVRYRFPGRRLLDALVDLPFALPTAVAGIALTAIYAPNGPLGSLFEAIGVKTAYSSLGIFIALVFIGLPFVVRSVQPVLEDLSVDIEEAAETLGASAWQRVFMVVLPNVWSALLAGVGLAFARAVGEYGSVIFIAGNLPLKTEIAPLLIVIKLEQFDYAGAATVGMAMLLLSFGVLMLFNFAQSLLSRRGDR